MKGHYANWPQYSVIRIECTQYIESATSLVYYDVSYDRSYTSVQDNTHIVTKRDIIFFHVASWSKVLVYPSVQVTNGHGRFYQLLCVVIRHYHVVRWRIRTDTSSSSTASFYHVQ